MQCSVVLCCVPLHQCNSIVSKQLVLAKTICCCYVMYVHVSLECACSGHQLALTTFNLFRLAPRSISIAITPRRNKTKTKVCYAYACTSLSAVPEERAFKMGGRRRHDVRAYMRVASLAKPLSVTTQQQLACMLLVLLLLYAM